MGLRKWLRSLVTRGTPEATRRVPLGPPTRFPATGRPPGLSLVPPPSAAEESFEPIWQVVSGSDASEPITLGVPERTQVERLSAQVRAHFTQNLPSPASAPRLAARVLDMVERPDVDMAQLVDEIRRDPAITTQLLKTANSAAHRRQHDVADLLTAITRVGLRDVAQIAAAVASRTLFDSGVRAEMDHHGPRFRDLFREAMACAFTASWYSFSRGDGLIDHSFLAGMLHDIGKPMALRSLARLELEGQLDEPPADAVIDAVLELVHVELGRDALAAWSLPPYLSITCSRHHDAVIGFAPEARELHAVRLISGLQTLRTAPRAHPQLREVRQGVQALGLDRAGLLELWHRLEAYELQVDSMC